MYAMIAQKKKETAHAAMMAQCSDTSEKCVEWARDEEWCNGEFGKLKCAVSCGTCAYATKPYGYEIANPFHPTLT